MIQALCKIPDQILPFSSAQLSRWRLICSSLKMLGGYQTYMEVIFSAIMSELASRSVSFLVEKYLKQQQQMTAAPTEEIKRLHRLRRLLLRVRVIVDEAEDRRITNQAMLHQLAILKKEMYRGCYILDSLTCCRVHGDDDDRSSEEDHHQVSHSFAPSKLNTAKRVRLCGGGRQSTTTLSELLEHVLGSLENTIGDAREFVMFLNGCPPLYRQPYRMHLMLGKCMFNRQMEMEHIVNFLLRRETMMITDPDPAAQDLLGVLPIIGPGRVGKSTLIEHACADQRVRNHFSQILRFTEDDLTNASAVTLRDRGITKHQNSGADCGGKPTLIIIELVLEIDECAWRRLLSSAKNRIPSGSKIIITSRSDSIARFGTTHALRVQFFTQEAYWYFFKVRLFGSTNAEDDHPQLTAIAMDMAREMEGCFMAAAILCELLKANFSPRFWSMALAKLRDYKQKNVSLHGSRFVSLYQIAEPLYVRRVKRNSSEYIVILDHYQRQRGNPAQSDEPAAEAPEILFFGSVRSQGKFKVLAWRSHLPPYCDYMFNCETRRL